MTLELSTTCRIMTRCNSASARLGNLVKDLHADRVDPQEYTCMRCRINWDGDVTGDYRDVTCSNCYSDRVLLTRVRLTFFDWGEHNGGAKEQMQRFMSAKKAVR